MNRLRRTNRPIRIAFALVAVAISITAPGCSCDRDPSGNGNGTTTQTQGESEASLAKISLALAATENMEPQEGGKLWADLRTRFPDDPSIALNEALNAVLAVDQLTATATDSSQTAEAKSAARSELPDAIDAARGRIEAYSKLSGDALTEIWLKTRVDAHEANLLGTTIGKSLRRDLFNRLASAINGEVGQEPKSVILGGPLTDVLEKLADPAKGLPPQILDPAFQSLRRLSDQNESNLFLALSALRLGLQKKDPSAKALADRTWQLAQAETPTLAAFTKPIGLTPKDLVDQITKAIDESDWATANRSFVLWSNVLNPLEILRTDRRIASPHPLDRLSFDTVRRVSAELSEANPIQKGPGKLDFEFKTIDPSAVVAVAVDADLDLQMDMVTVDEQGAMSLFQIIDSQWISTAQLDLNDVPSGVVVADLFMVDSSNADRLERQAPIDADESSVAKGDGDQSEQEYALSVRHDTLPSLIVYGEHGIQLIQIDTRDGTPEDQRLTIVEKASGFEDVGPVSAVTVGDLEGDGDLDLIVAPREGSLRAFSNRGNRTFFEVPIGSITVDATDPIQSMEIADLDRDIDLDVVTIHQSGRVGVLENLLHLQFRFSYLKGIPALKTVEGDALSITVEDVDSNVSWDVITSSSQQSLVAFGHSSDVGVWTVDRVETGKGFSASPKVEDLDNDSYLEMFDGQRATKLGPWGIAPIEANSFSAENGRLVDVADVNSDGLMDVVTTSGDGVGVGLNLSPSDFHRIAVRFKGINDNAAASGRVNHYGIGSVLELRFGPHYRSRIVRRATTHFGIDGMQSADAIRVIMPNGLTQTIRDPAIDSVVEEEQTLKGSCPYLYAWDGEKFAFVTDCLWAAPLGLQVAAGVVQPDRPWEYLKVDGDFVQENDNGEYELRLTEELWEVAYVDHVELTAVDHPADVDIFTNEKVGPPGIAKPTIYSFSPDELHPIDRATDTAGKDVTELLLESDEQYVQGFDRRIRQGLCPPHWIEMDFSSAAKEIRGEEKSGAQSRPLYLVVRGWILPTDTSLNIQIDQNPELPAVEYPSVWVPDGKSGSGWRNVIPFMGFPGGKTKTIVVDVTEHFVEKDPRFRVRTSAQIYWDSATIAVGDHSRGVKTQVAELVHAEVAHHGFSAKRRTDLTRPETYDYADADLQPKWPPLRGVVSRFGDCTNDLKSWDDSMAVISGGDEIRMRFKVPSQPTPPGWKRDFVLHCVGWDKDADLNTLTGQSIGPLPIREMKGYPPTMESQSEFDRVREKNAPSRNRSQSFRAFWHRGAGLEKPYLSASLPWAPKAVDRWSSNHPSTD